MQNDKVPERIWLTTKNIGTLVDGPFYRVAVDEPIDQEDAEYIRADLLEDIVRNSCTIENVRYRLKLIKEKRNE